MRKSEKRMAVLLAAAILACTACSKNNEKEDVKQELSGQMTVGQGRGLYPDAQLIVLSEKSAELNGAPVEEFDYTWHCDPSVSHSEVKNAPAEYYTGTKPDTEAVAYIDHELYYFPELAEAGFRQIQYDGETEWAYYYADGEHDEYIFATLPALGRSLPAQMMHSEEEAAENYVLHITKPGVYLLEGKWNGQINVSLGDQDDCFADENAKVTLILNGVDITCTVAPGLIFYSAYECDNAWEEASGYTAAVDTSEAGVSLVLAAGSENYVSGTNVYRMLKTKYKDESTGSGVPLQKKQRKTDAALYSYVTMNILGKGALSVTSGFEGLDSELHLNLMDGTVIIHSQDDGINVNEDGVSVVIFSGADVTINAALGAEGDGVDSNGFVRIDGGRISVNGIRVPDSALDSECGIFYNGGEVLIDGVSQAYTPGSSFRESGGGPGQGGPGGPGQGGPGGPGGPGQGGPGQDGPGGPGQDGPGQGGPDGPRF